MVIITVKLRFVRLQIREQRFETVSACLVFFRFFFFFDTENTMLVQMVGARGTSWLHWHPGYNCLFSFFLWHDWCLTSDLRLSRFCFRTGMCQLLTLIFLLFIPLPHTPRSQHLSQKKVFFTMFKIRSVPIAFVLKSLSHSSFIMIVFSPLDSIELDEACVARRFKC